MLEPFVDSAFEYAYPLHAVATTRFRAVQDPSNPRRHSANSLLHERHLDIALQHVPPTDPTRLANWLPAPAGPFQIALRAYLPRAGLRDARAVMPNIVRA